MTTNIQTHKYHFLLAYLTGSFRTAEWNYEADSWEFDKEQNHNVSENPWSNSYPSQKMTIQSDSYHVQYWSSTDLVVMSIKQLL